MNKKVQITSISWIDGQKLPHAGFSIGIGCIPWIGSWVNRVIMGLVATSNPTPPAEINLATFRSLKQYRALTSYELQPLQPGKAQSVILDPGFTPPFDSSKLQTFLRHFASIPDDAKKFSKGEYSNLSGCTENALHPASTLTLASGDQVLASLLIKFRAGETTNAIGISSDVGSPVHVPWVWCEHALVRSKDRYKLLCNGSVFPSHAWYINGKQVSLLPQAIVTVSENEPAISKGRPKNQPRSNSQADNATGVITDHEFAIKANQPLEIDVTNLLT